MQEDEARKRERMLLSDFESRLTKAEHDSVRRGIRRGIRDIETGRYEEYDAVGLRTLPKKLVAASARRLSRRRNAR